MNCFEDAFDDSGIEAMKAKILPEFTHDKKIAVQVADLAGIFANEELDCGKTDAEVWQCLLNATGQKVKIVLRKALEAAGVPYEVRELNKLQKSQSIRLFFNIFELSPAAQRRPAEEVRLEQWLMKVLPEPGKRHWQIKAEEYAKISPDIERDFGNGSHAERKAILSQLLKICAAQWSETELQALPEDIALPFFRRVFAIEAACPSAQPSAPPLQSGEDHVPGDVVAPNLEQAQLIYNAAKIVPAEEFDSDIDATAITMYDGMPVTAKDHQELSLSRPGDVFCGLVMLANPDTGKVAAIGHIKEGLSEDGSISPHLIFAADDIIYPEFASRGSMELVLVPKAQAAFFSTSLDDERASQYRGELYRFKVPSRLVSSILESDNTLCIDFGTSNTTVGTWGNGLGKDDISLVTFEDVTADKPTIKDMLPTMVYVKSCGHGGSPEYLFGYEAKKELVENDYMPRGSFFFEVKRWLNSMGDEIEIMDEKDMRTSVRRQDIIFAYLQYVIAMAEQQYKMRFKKLHFTAPVKQKATFLSCLEKLFANTGKKIVAPEDSIDEGVAIVYHSALEYLKAERSENSVNILVLDCGGGTTDLASCKCEYQKSDIENVLKISTGFENGDSNFGGNNITFRVLQMLKIKIANQLAGNGSITMDTLVPYDENQILELIDNQMASQAEARDEIYSRFESSYVDAEKFVPTRFAEYKKIREKTNVRRNFYYLWQMAEAIKIEFYKKNLVNVDFGKNNQEDIKIYAGDMDQYYLTIREQPDGEFKKRPSPLRDIEITFKEIDRILCADIYGLMNTLIPFDKNDAYSYRLSGQSCKISLFHNLLKEFVPGKSLREAAKYSADRSSAGSPALKKYCIEGSIEFNRDKHFGSIRPEFKRTEIRHIYNVSFVDSDQTEKEMLVCKADKVIVYPVTRPHNTRDVVMRVRDQVNRIKNEFSRPVYRGERQNPCDNIEELKKRILPLTTLDERQLDTQIFDKILNIGKEVMGGGVLCLLALPSRHAYGLRFCQIGIDARDGKVTYWVPEEIPTIPYENEELQTFFNGKR